MSEDVEMSEVMASRPMQNSARIDAEDADDDEEYGREGKPPHVGTIGYMD